MRGRRNGRGGHHRDSLTCYDISQTLKRYGALMKVKGSSRLSVLTACLIGLGGLVACGGTPAAQLQTMSGNSEPNQPKPGKLVSPSADLLALRVSQMAQLSAQQHGHWKLETSTSHTTKAGKTTFTVGLKLTNTDQKAHTPALIPAVWNAGAETPFFAVEGAAAEQINWQSGTQPVGALPIQGLAGSARRGWLATDAVGAGESLTLTLTFDAPETLHQFELLLALRDTVPAPVTAIGAVQGKEAESPLLGQEVIVEGVVTAYLPALKGFFVQEPALFSDADSQTSDGLFVYCGAACTPVSAGQLVRVKGKVAEYEGQTQLTEPVMTPLTTYQPLPARVVSLPFSDRERYEGMWLTVGGEVTGNYELGRYGSFQMADARIFNYTQQHRPDAAGFAAYQKEIDARLLVVDDGKSEQNPEHVFGRNGQPLSAQNTLRGGDRVRVTGVLSEWKGYRLQVSDPALLSIEATNIRPVQPELAADLLRVGSMNVLNYFNTLVKENVGCTSGGIQKDARGAENCEEFLRQQTKIVAAIEGIDAAILGLNEIENDYAEGVHSSAAWLVAALNQKAGFEKYAYIDPGKNIGTDKIAVGLLYQPTLVSPVGSLAILDSRIDPAYDDTKNRPALAQTFQEKATGGRLTVAVTHLKSKGRGEGCQPDRQDGQGNCAVERTAAANSLARWLQSDPTGVPEDDRLIMGDLNSYAKEDPIAAIEAQGYSNVFDSSAYSYQFAGQWGSLDHALVSGSLAGQVVGKTKWHINADEPAVLDYNTNYKKTSQQESYYAPDAFRSSDHDPVLVGLKLTPQSPLPSTPPSVSVPVPPSQDASLLISEYLEGEKNNKAIELYNAGTDTIDLTQYQLAIYSNGKTQPQLLSLQGSLAAGKTHVLVHNKADEALTKLAQQSVPLSFNGNDAVALLRADQLVDVIGVIGQDPGKAWQQSGLSTADMTLRRLPQVNKGKTTFDWSEWKGDSATAWNGLGQR